MTDLFSIAELDVQTSMRELSWQIKKRAVMLDAKYKIGKKTAEHLVRNYLFDCLGGYEGTLEDYLCLKETKVKAE